MNNPFLCLNHSASQSFPIPCVRRFTLYTHTAVHLNNQAHPFELVFLVQEPAEFVLSFEDSAVLTVAGYRASQRLDRKPCQGYQCDNSTRLVPPPILARPYRL